MSTFSKKATSLTVVFALAVGTISPSFASSSLPPRYEAPAMSIVALPLSTAAGDILSSVNNSVDHDLSLLSSAPALSAAEAEEVEGGIPLVIIMALAGAASAMGFYLYGVIVQHKKFSAKEFAKRGGCGAFIGLLGRFFVNRAAVIRVLGAGSTGMGLAACFAR